MRAAGSLSGAAEAAVEPSEASPGAVYTVQRRCVRARGGPDRKFRFEKYFTEFLMVLSSSILCSGMRKRVSMMIRVVPIEKSGASDSYSALRSADSDK